MTRTAREHLWQQHITDWQASGLSGMAYCQQQSLTYCRFVYWRKKLTDVEPVADETGASGFARVAPVVRESTTDGLTVSLPGGVSIAGLHAGNIELLGTVLRQL
ncbi:MAG: IS66 family insertion sequence element accessory protein TnpB [Marinobacter sp.]|nr:IS66 family insertion sequence element accessory protein TnpB [Marinobacter sp.]